MIYWSEFTWEAFATLSTGLAAVGGAVFVGLRQLAIAKRQTDITEGQTKILALQAQLEQMKIRSDLYDRRFAVFDATETYLVAVLNSEKRATIDAQVAFAKAIDHSRFLFEPAVFANLNGIRKDAEKLFTYRTMLDSYQARQQTPHPVPAEKIDAMYAQTEKVTDGLVFMMTHLSETFGDELRIGTMPKDLTPPSKQPDDFDYRDWVAEKE